RDPLVPADQFEAAGPVLALALAGVERILAEGDLQHVARARPRLHFHEHRVAAARLRPLADVFGPGEYSRHVHVLCKRSGGTVVGTSLVFYQRFLARTMPGSTRWLPGRGAARPPTIETG